MLKEVLKHEIVGQQQEDDDDESEFDLQDSLVADAGDILLPKQIVTVDPFFWDFFLLDFFSLENLLDF